MISGAFVQEIDVPKFDITFENAAEVDMQKPDYYIEVSGELLISKIRPFDTPKDEFRLPPFFNALHAMRSEAENSNNEYRGIFKV